MELKEKIQEYKTYLIIAAIIIGLITFNIYTLTLVKYDEEAEEEIFPIKEKTKSKIKVDIKGEINAAGVYELDKGSRVNDLINKAGGITKQGDTSIINLSKKLEDEMIIIIYSKNEVNKLKTQNNSSNITDICPKENDACPEKQLETIIKKENKTKSTDTKISLNTATIDELQNLNGIGEAKAKAIIKYREENGNFKTIDDIKNVSGIGDAAFEKIKDQITT